MARCGCAGISEKIPKTFLLMLRLAPSPLSPVVTVIAAALLNGPAIWRRPGDFADYVGGGWKRLRCGRGPASASDIFRKGPGAHAKVLAKPLHPLRTNLAYWRERGGPFMPVLPTVRQAAELQMSVLAPVVRLTIVN